MSDQDEKIKQRLHTIFPDPVTASKVVDLVVHNKPLGWGRKSNAPYFKEIYALQVKEDIDKMIENGNPICYRYAKWCNENTGMSFQTLYNRINQSIRFLLEKMDADGKYRKWYETVKIERERSVGVVISFIVGLHDGATFKAEEIQPRENMPLWKRRMDDWLESDSTKPFCEEGLILTPEEVTELTLDLSKLTNIQASVKSSSIKIIRLND